MQIKNVCAIEPGPGGANKGVGGIRRVKKVSPPAKANVEGPAYHSRFHRFGGVRSDSEVAPDAVHRQWTKADGAQAVIEIIDTRIVLVTAFEGAVVRRRIGGLGLFYRPVNPDAVAPDGELPPLVVRSHGGPTANAANALDLTCQYLTSRGIAVVDVDYGGSTGYGREYRKALEGEWGVVDVDDCVGAARYLVDRGDVDGERLAIEGGSAGGYTTLAALAFRDQFAAGITAFGIADLEMLVRDSHKFESHYEEGLIGPYPAMADRYRDRSPIHHLDAISVPVLILQGLEDKVVPPAQAEALAAALAARGVPHAYLAFEGEGHGFRGEAAQRRTLEAHLAFLGAVFGFTPADDLPPLEVHGIEDWARPSPVAHGSIA